MNQTNELMCSGGFAESMYCYLIDWGNEFMNDFVGRFAWTKGGLAGDDRVSASFDALYQEYLQSNDVLFGRGATYGLNMGTSSYKSLLLQFGFLGFGFYFVLWLYAMLSEANKDRDCILLLLLFIISLYQRPVPITSSYGYVLLIGGVVSIHFRKRNGLIIHQIKD